MAVSKPCSSLPSGSLHQRDLGSFLVFFLLLTLMIAPDTLCGTCCFYPDLFRSQIGFVHISIAKCWIKCIYSASSISDVVNLSTVDGNSQRFRLEVLETSIPKLVRRYLNRIFIFLLLMEDNPSEKLYDELLWRRQWFVNGDALSLLYGDVGIVVESWQLQFLFFFKESVYWILYGKLFLDLNCKLADVIQQEELMFMENVLRYKVWSLILWMIARYENRKRSRTSRRKEKDKFAITYEARRIVRLFFNRYFLCDVVLSY